MKTKSELKKKQVATYGDFAGKVARALKNALLAVSLVDFFDMVNGFSGFVP